MPVSVSVTYGRRAIGHLTVIAGPAAVGKSYLIRKLAEHDELREQMGIAKDVPALTARAFLKMRRSGTIDHLVLHYDILRPFYHGFPSYELDPGTAGLRSAERITFFTLRTTPERLRTQLEARIARRSQKHLLTLRTLYTDDRFIADWYDHWLRSVQLYRDVTAGHYFVDAHRDYALTPLEDDVPCPAVLPRTALATPSTVAPLVSTTTSGGNDVFSRGCPARRGISAAVR